MGVRREVPVKYMRIIILLAAIAALTLSACGGTVSSVPGSSGSTGDEQAIEGSAEEGDGSQPGSYPADSPEGYGAIQKFNEFSISFLTVLVDSLENAVEGFDFSVSKAFYGDLSGVDCSCSLSSALLSCDCDSVNGGSCEGSAWHGENSSLIEAAISCDDFHLFAETVFAGSLEATVSISPVLREVLGNSFGGFFASKSLGDEGDACSIDEQGVCWVSQRVCLVSLASASVAIGEDGLSTSDSCGNFSFGPGSNVEMDLCLSSLTSFYTTFSIEGVFNDQPADMTSSIECDVEGIASF